MKNNGKKKKIEEMGKTGITPQREEKTLDETYPEEEIGGRWMVSDTMITLLLVVNGIINTAILVIVVPLSDLKGKVCMIRQTLDAFEARLLSLEERL